MGIILFFVVLAMLAMVGNASRADFSIINNRDLREDDAIMELYELWLTKYKKSSTMALTRRKRGSLNSKTIL